MAMILMVLGGGFLVVGGVWLLIEGFKESVLWGIAMLLINVVSLIFVITHWQQAKRPFLLQIVGLVLVVAGVMLTEKPPGPM